MGRHRGPRVNHISRLWKRSTLDKVNILAWSIDAVAVPVVLIELLAK